MVFTVTKQGNERENYFINTFFFLDLVTAETNLAEPYAAERQGVLQFVVNEGGVQMHVDYAPEPHKIQ